MIFTPVALMCHTVGKYLIPNLFGDRLSIKLVCKEQGVTKL